MQIDLCYKRLSSADTAPQSNILYDFCFTDKPVSHINNFMLGDNKLCATCCLLTYRVSTKQNIVSYRKFKSG